MSQSEYQNLRPRETASMLTRDGVRLDADVYRPEAEGPFPVLLMRQPYGRAIASTVSHAHPTWYARQGYIVVIQDVRGRGTSEGEFRLLEQELEDGFDSVAWAAGMPGSTGQVGMYGFSYQGMTQLFAAGSGAPALRAICPAMIAYEVYEHFAYENGALRLELSMAWALQLATETARRKGDAKAHQELFAASRSLPLHDESPLKPTVLETHGAYCHYHDWISNAGPGPYWEKISPKTAAERIDVPALHIGGWFDAFLPGTLACYRDMKAKCSQPQRLVIGPWVHIPWSSKVGDRDFGPSAISPIDQMQVRWFDHWLKGKDTGLMEEPPILLYEMGGERWRAFDDWPNQPADPYYLSSTGRASIDMTDGRLTPDPGTLTSEDAVVHDPWRPVPSVGGHLGFPHGSVDRSELDGRSDILAYTSPPLEDDLHLAGDVTLELWCKSDQPSFDISAVVSEVYPDGRAFTLTQTHACIDGAAETGPVRLSLRAICCRIQKGHCVRVSLAGSCFPAYAINPGTQGDASEAKLIDQRIITLFVDSGANFPSCLFLPRCD